MKKAAIILVRLDSIRFPGKALKYLGKKYLIEWCIDAMLPQDEFEVILATTDRPIDQPLVNVAERRNIKIFRGCCENVALRIKQCVETYNIEIFARVNGDSPFPQRDLITEAFRKIEHEKFDFVTNLIPRMYPYGIAVEVFRSLFYTAHFSHFINENEFEHVTPYFYQNIDKISAYKMEYCSGNDHAVRLVVDTPSDLQHLQKVINNIPDEKPGLQNIIREYKKIQGYD